MTLNQNSSGMDEDIRSNLGFVHLTNALTIHAIEGRSGLI